MPEPHRGNPQRERYWGARVFSRAGFADRQGHFAFTDIEGSTARWERDPLAMQTALRRHDALVREAIAKYGGYAFTTAGDAFCVAFQCAQDAVAAMLDVQLALAAEDFSAVGGLRVRAAIHTGTADERDADYLGPTVNRVARRSGGRGRCVRPASRHVLAARQRVGRQ